MPASLTGVGIWLAACRQALLQVATADARRRTLNPFNLTHEVLSHYASSVRGRTSMTQSERVTNEVTKLLAQSSEILERIEPLLKTQAGVRIRHPKPDR